MLEQGVEAFQNMNFAKAISCLSPIEDSFDELDDDSKATLAFILGTCYLHTDNYKKARIMFEIVKSCSPSDKRISIQILPSLLSVYSELKDEVLIYTFHFPCSLCCCSKSVHSKQNKHRISSTISFILHSLMMRPSTCLFVLIHMMILAGSLPQINIMSKYLHFYNSLF